MTDKGDYKGKCEHCAIAAPAHECDLAEIDAVWVDADGETTGKVYRVCRSCYDAGCETGPGYRKVDPIADYAQALRFPLGMGNDDLELDADGQPVSGMPAWFVETL